MNLGVVSMNQWFPCAALLTSIAAPLVCGAADPPPEWKIAATRTHAKFTGRSGTLALFGDSITVSLAFWAPLQGEYRGASPELDRAIRRVQKHLKPECWREWRGPEFGNDAGRTAAWGAEHVDAWLKRLNPETAVVLFGTNDLREVSPDAYRKQLRDRPALHRQRHDRDPDYDPAAAWLRGEGCSIRRHRPTDGARTEAAAH